MYTHTYIHTHTNVPYNELPGGRRLLGLRRRREAGSPPAAGARSPKFSIINMTHYLVI